MYPFCHLLFVFVCHTVVSVACSLVVTCFFSRWEGVMVVVVVVVVVVVGVMLEVPVNIYGNVWMVS